MWLTCADCSSLGLDKCHYYGDLEKVPETGACSHCGGSWPKQPKRTLEDAVKQMKAEILGTDFPDKHLKKLVIEE